MGFWLEAHGCRKLAALGLSHHKQINPKPGCGQPYDAVTKALLTWRSLSSLGLPIPSTVGWLWLWQIKGWETGYF